MIRTVAVIGILLTIPAKATDLNDKDSFLQLVQQLKNDEAEPRSQAVQRLVAMEPDVLSLFFSHFVALEDVVRNRFATEVVPRLHDDRVKEQLLSELRTGAPVARKDNKLRRGEKVEGFESTHASMESFQRALDRWNWTLHALGATAVPDAYDELYILCQEVQDENGMDYRLVRALYKSDSDRAVRDLETMLRDDLIERRMQGLSMYWLLAPLIPDCNLLRSMYDESPGTRAAIAGLLRQSPPRECLGLLLDLCEHPDAVVRNIVDEALRSLGHISREGLQKMMQGATDPSARAKVWRTWWDESGRLSSEELRLRGCQETFRLAEAKLSQGICESLGQCGDQAETYKILEIGILSDDLSIQTIAASCLDWLVHFGNPMAVEFLLDFCSTHDAEHTTRFAWRLSRLKHERTVPTLIAMLERGKKSGGSPDLAAFGALAVSKDPRAIETIRELLSEQPCLASQLVGSEFHTVPGAESVVPHLLRGMIEAPNGDCYRKLQLLIAKIGGPQLPGQLVEILPDAPAGKSCRAGPDVGLLQLMESFPDPAAQPMLLGLLKSPNHLTRLHAARVLGRLGDASGVPILLNDLFLDSVSIFDYYEDVGAALRAIASPQTPPQLLAVYDRCGAEKRRWVLQVITLQDDPAYLVFWESLLDQNDDGLVKAASQGIARVVWKAGRQVKTDQVIPGDRLHDSIITLMRWALRDEAPTNRDRQFEDRESLGEARRALVQTNAWQYLVYDVSTDKLRQIEYGDTADYNFMKKASPRSEELVLGGAECREFGDYVVARLQISASEVSYLFRRRDGQWKPVGRCSTASE